MRSNLRVLGVLLLLSTAQAGSYTVQKNDTLYSLSKRFGIPVEELMKLNGLNEPKLNLGQVLQVPDEVAPSVATPAKTTPREHIVAKQETLFGIARKYGLRVEDLKSFNGLTSNEIAIGQVLKLTQEASPNTASSAPKTESKTGPKTNTSAQASNAPSNKAAQPAKPETKPAPASSNSKTSKVDPVKPETAKTDAAKPEPAKTEPAKTEPAKSNAENAGAKDSKLETTPATSLPKPQEVQAVSKESPTGPAVKTRPVLAGATIHVVQRGDNLYNLARKYGVTVDDLMAWNALDSSTLAVGQSLQLIARVQPAAEPAPVTTVASTSTAKEPVKEETKEPVRVTSTVKPSETGKPLDPSQVTVKAVQVVDSATVITPVSTPERHVVQKGDTLSTLARKYATTVSALQEANQLMNTDLKVGQVLILPSALKNIPEPTNLVSITSGTSTPWRDYAMSLMNLPYVYGGTNPEKGLDCSGFTLLVMQQAGIQLPRTSLQQSQVGEVVDRNSLQAGDLIFFDTLGHGVSHVGIYLGDNQFIHANSYLEKVSIDDITNSYYAKRVVSYRRVLAAPSTAQRQ